MQPRHISTAVGLVVGAIAFLYLGTAIRITADVYIGSLVTLSVLRGYPLIGFLVVLGALYGAACGWVAERIQEAVRSRWGMVARTLFWLIVWYGGGVLLALLWAVAGTFILFYYAWGSAILFYALFVQRGVFWASVAGALSGLLIRFFLPGSPSGPGATRDRRTPEPAVWGQGAVVLLMIVGTGMFSFRVAAPRAEPDPGPVRGITFSPDGRLTASGGTDGAVVLWDVESGKEVRRFDKLGNVLCVAFASDGQSLLAMDNKGSLGVWSVDTGKLIRRRDGAKQLAGCAFSPDRRLLALTAFDPQDGTALLDVGSGTVIWQLPASRKGIASDAGMAFSSDGRVLLATDSSWPRTGAGLRLLGVATGAEVRSFGAEYHVEAVAFSPDGRLAISDGGSAAHVWDVESGGEIRPLRSSAKPVSAVTFSPDGRLALTGSADGILRVWDVHAGKRLLRVVGPPGPIRSVAFSPDGRQILSGHEEGTLLLWDAASGERIRSIRAPLAKPVTSPADQAPHDEVNAIVFSPDGRRMLSGGLGRIAHLWDVLEGSETRRVDLDCGEILSLAFVPDGRRALAGCRDGSAIFFDLETGEDVQAFQDSELVLTVAFSADGSRALTRGDERGPVRVWALETGKQLRRFDFRGYRDRKVAFSPDGRRLLTYGDGVALPLWDVETGQEIRQFDSWAIGRPRGGAPIVEEVRRVQFSPDGRLVIAKTFYDRTDFAVFLDVGTGRALRRLKVDQAYSNLAVSADGGRLLFGDAKGHLHLMDALTGNEIRRFGPHEGTALVALSPDGRLAASGGNDGTVRLWDVETGQEIRRFGDALKAPSR